MHEKNREYNGYTNYETWNFKLWADNDQPTYQNIQSLVKHTLNDKIKLNKTEQIYMLSNWLRDYADDKAPEIEASFYSDVMNASIREVDYRQVAEMLLEA